MTIFKYVVVQRTGFVPYFLYAWREGSLDSDVWNCSRALARQFDGPTARRIAAQINGRQPAAVIPVEVEVVLETSR